MDSDTPKTEQSIVELAVIANAVAETIRERVPGYEEQVVTVNMLAMMLLGGKAHVSFHS